MSWKKLYAKMRWDEKTGTNGLSRSQAMKLQCASCMGYYVDGRHDCEMTDCPLYPWMPYRNRNDR